MGYVNDLIGPTPTTETSTGPTLTEWNSTLCIQASAWGAQASGWFWRPPQDQILSWYDGIQWAMPVANSYQGNVLPTLMAVWCINSGTLVTDSIVWGSSPFQIGWGVYAGYSTTTGQQQWIENITFPPYTGISVSNNWIAGDGVWETLVKETGVLTGYSLATGAQLWTLTLKGINGAQIDPYDSIGYYSGIIAGGTLYLTAFGGDIWSINFTTGTVNWYTNTTMLQGSSGTNSPYGVWPFGSKNWRQCC